jgi:serine/threonine-protein kinase
MRVCPTCGARYEAPAQYCQRDGVPLRIEQEARDPYLGTKILGQFRLEKVIGSGGMGIVYSGWDEGLGRRVAVKILHRDLVANRDVVARFHREAQIAHQLDHPNIVRLILFGQLPDGNLYLVLEYLEGPTLLQAIDENGALPPARAVKIASSVSDAIGYAHRRDIIHRDLKPENIMLVNRDGDADHPKVLDFGIAKMLIGGDTLVTQAGLIFGTARYISPEGAQGDPVDKRSDVYSLGIIAYQLLSGVTPFDSQEPVQLLLKHIHETPAALRSHPGARNVPPALESVVMRAIAKTPAARYGDGTSFAKALREALAESDPNAAIRSVIPTTAMPMFVPPNGASASNGSLHPTVPVAAVAPMPVANPARVDSHVGAPAYAGASTPYAGSADASQSRAAVVAQPVTSHSTVLAGSPAHAYAQSAPETPAQNVYAPVRPPPGSSGPYPAVHGSAAIAMPAVQRPSPTVAVPAFAPPASMPVVEADATGPSLRNAFAAHTPDPPSASSAISSSAAIDTRDSADDISIPGLPRSKSRKKSVSSSGSSGSNVSGSNRTVVTIIASVLTTLLIGATAAWALGLYPSQRRELEVRGLLGRADDALHAERYLHEPDENDVEDLTDAVLALDPNNARARQMRSVAAVRLRNRAVEMRNGGHPDQALPLLRSATRLVEDSEIRTLIDTIENEMHAPVPTTPAVVTPPPAPAQRPATRVRHPGAAPDPEPAGPETTQPTQTTFHPTFTPGRDPNQPANVQPQPQPPVQPQPQPQVQPHPQPNPDPPQMHGGPSQPESPQPDPNGGAVAF